MTGSVRFLETKYRGTKRVICIQLHVTTFRSSIGGDISNLYLTVPQWQLPLYATIWSEFSNSVISCHCLDVQQMLRLLTG